MTYSISGLDPARFADRDRLVAQGAIRQIASASSGYPCRVSLEPAAEGEAVWLVPFLHADVATPFRASHAIFVREDAIAAPVWRDAVPPILDACTVSLRAFDAGGMIHAAAVMAPGEADRGIRAMMDLAETHHVDAHNAAWGCFLARAERSRDD